ncbi:hypothetical protein WJX72_011408 [[Myrmecia] bisecta]|uniref:Uncharacterized protein n=1 Tax=[Myrmecia] bisecta TaxID=41462 RepID=A0AAW1QGG0_9CHLO
MSAVEHLQWIEEQLDALPKLTPESAERLREHRIRGITLLRQRLAALGPYPATTAEEQAVWENQKRQIEEDVQLEMQTERLMEPPLEEAWDVWLAKDKLKAMKDNTMVDLAGGMGGSWLPESLRIPPLSPASAYHQQSEGQLQVQAASMSQPHHEHASPHHEHLDHQDHHPVHEPHQPAHDQHQQVLKQQGLEQGLEEGLEQHQAVLEHEQQLQHHALSQHVQPGLAVQQHYEDPQDQQLHPHEHHEQHLPPQQAQHDPAPGLGPLDMDPGSMKLCRRCNQHKPLSQFYKSKANSDGHDGRCKACDALQCADRRRKKQRVEQPTVESKPCRRCGEVKLATEFYRNKTNPDGLYNNCKACFAADAQERRSRLAPLEDRAVSQKTCKRCQQTKPASDFYRNKLMADGLYSHCKLCYGQAASERSAERQIAPEKLCRRCKVVKTSEEFYHSKMTSDGLQSYCKACYAAAAVARRERISQAAALNEQQPAPLGEPQALPEQHASQEAAQHLPVGLAPGLAQGIPTGLAAGLPPGTSLQVQLEQEEVPQLMHGHVHAPMPQDY